MYQIVITNKFKKDVKLLHRRGYDMELMKRVIIQFEEQGKLPKILNLINYPETS